MLIDWFTVIAQIINFLILVLLLKRFLYGPIIRAMNEREAKITARLTEAETMKQAAQAEAAAYRRQQQELDRRREELLAQAREEAETWRKTAISKARQEIEEARANWRQSIEAEKQAFVHEVRQRVSQQVYAISRQALTDLADAHLEQRMIEVLLGRLGRLDGRERAAVTESLLKSGGALVVRSAHAIPPDIQPNIASAIRERLGAEVEVQFEVEPDLLCGVEMAIKDHKLAWTLDDYLISLEENLLEVLNAEAEPDHAG